MGLSPRKFAGARWWSASLLSSARISWHA